MTTKSIKTRPQTWEIKLKPNILNSFENYKLYIERIPLYKTTSLYTVNLLISKVLSDERSRSDEWSFCVKDKNLPPMQRFLPASDYYRALFRCLNRLCSTI